ncbi:MAG: DUF4167 domain-containing protein [Alphaproteobacteria bacterium]|nr:DUF4167 domain-containing protein [Alphaproteobacteria bacterium]
MRPQHNMKRSRGRGRHKPQNLSNRTMESNGPDVKVRGTAQNIYEKYQQLARDAASTGDRIMAENYLQHAEHYFRVMLAFAPAPNAPGQGAQPGNGNGNGNGQNHARPSNGAPGQPGDFQGLPGSAFPGDEGDDLAEGEEEGEDARV